MRACRAHDHRQVAHAQLAHAMHGGQAHTVLVLELEQDASRLGDRHLGLCFVVEPRHRLSFGVIAHDAGEDHHTTGTGMRYRSKHLVDRQRRVAHVGQYVGPSGDGRQ